MINNTVRFEWRGEVLSITLESGSWATYKKSELKPFRFQTGLVSSDYKHGRGAEVLCLLDDLASIEYEKKYSTITDKVTQIRELVKSIEPSSRDEEKELSEEQKRILAEGIEWMNELASSENESW